MMRERALLEAARPRGVPATAPAPAAEEEDAWVGILGALADPLEEEGDEEMPVSAAAVRSIPRRLSLVPAEAAVP